VFIPLYSYIHPKTGEIFEELRLMSKRDEPFIAPDGTPCPRDATPCWQGDIQMGAVLPSRAERKETEHRKKVKDPERAMKNRKSLFGTEGVSITKSENYHKEKKIKAKGTSDVSKTDFIKAAARNPRAMTAALKATKRLSQ
jgi:hypothetical protein